MNSFETELKARHVLESWGFGVQWMQLFMAWCNANPGVACVPGRVVSWEHGVAEAIVARSDSLSASVAPQLSTSEHCPEIASCLCEVTGNLRRRLQSSEHGIELATGDWIVVEMASTDGSTARNGRILDVLPRRSQFRRRMAGSDVRGQTVAANVDKVLVVTSANNDFNARRLERYLVAVWDGGATPVIVLNKIDLSDQVEDMLLEIQSVAAGAIVVAVSAESRQGLDQLADQIRYAETIAMVGSSGVGKSSLFNRLVGRDVAATGGIDELEKGRHTTTRRSMLLLPSGGVLIDNPGMREFGLLDAAGGLDSAFPDIMALASGCRFHDCAHRTEPGCAVLLAVEEGTLDGQRLSSFQKLGREMAALRARTEPRLQSELKQGYKIRARAHRALKKSRKAC